MFSSNAARPNMPLPQSREIEITKSIGEFIVDGLHPTSITETKAFRNLMYTMEPRYTVPARKTIKNNILDKMYTTLRGEICDELKLARNVAITHDGWTSLNNESYDTVTVHYIIETPLEWILRGKVLATKLVEGSHTSEAIAQSLTLTKAEWFLPDLVAVTDNAANERKAFEILQWTRLPCLGHNINLCVKSGLAVSEAARLVGKGRNLVSFFNRSPSATTFLQQKQAALLPERFKKLHLIQDVATRWNSTLDMLDRLSNLMPALHATVIDPEATVRVKDQRKNLYTFEEQVLVEKLSTILAPFKTATTLMSGERTPTLHQVVPCIMKLNRVMEIEEEDPASIKKIKAAMKQNLDKRPNELITFRMASALHPATKQLHFLPEDERAAVFKELREEAENLDKTPPVIKQEPADSQVLPPQPQLPQLPHLEVPTPDPEPPAKKIKQEEEERSESWLDDIIFVGQEKIACPKSAISQELDRYLLEPASVEPALKWWKNRSNVFPNVAILAKKYLCIPASSVPSERIFSLASNIVTKKRCRLSSEMVDHLIFLHKNRKQ